LTVRELPKGDTALLGPPPIRVVLDARGRVEARGALFDPKSAPTLVVTTDAAAPDALAAWNDAGAEVAVVGPGAGGHGVDIDATLLLLGERGVLQAIVEGGSLLHQAFLAEGRASRLAVYVGNTLLGPSGTPALPLKGIDSIADAPRFGLRRVVRLGDDCRMDYEVS